jgi:hypothetical protein
MKSCPTCSQTYDDTLTYCLVDGSVLSSPHDPNVTLQFPEPRKTEPPPTEILPDTNQEVTTPSSSTQKTIQSSLPRPFIPEAKQSQSYGKQTDKSGRLVTGIVFSFVIIALVILLAIAVIWGMYNSIQLSREREARRSAEQEAATNRTALAEAEKRAKDAEEIVTANEAIRMGKEVWRIVKIENRTKGDISYQVLVNGTSYDYTVKVGTPLLHEFDADIIVTYDYSYASGYQEKRYRLTPKYVIGHKPTEAEEQQAKVNYFTLDKDGNIELYYEK